MMASLSTAWRSVAGETSDQMECLWLGHRLGRNHEIFADDSAFECRCVAGTQAGINIG